jgi:hypothetical protein
LIHKIPSVMMPCYGPYPRRGPGIIGRFTANLNRNS